MPYFSSVRAINEAAYKAMYNTLNGEHVYFSRELPVERGEEPTTERKRVRRAKTVKGELYVLLLGKEEWIGPCAWGQVTQSRI